MCYGYSEKRHKTYCDRGNPNSCKKYGMDKVILFGSRARGDYRRTSDIDIAVYGGDINRFAADVDEETSTLLKFDIVDMDSPMQEELRASIMRKSVPLYEKI